MSKKTSKKIKIIPPKNELIVQHNKLVESRYRLSLQEKRVVLWIMSQIKPDDDDFTKHTISIRDFQKITGVSGNNMHKEIAKITMSLIQRGLSIRDLKNDTLLQVSWLNSAYYHYQEGLVELKIAQELKPYLLQLKKQFTVVNLADVMGLQSMYSVRIFELLKQYESLGVRVITLSDLRECCGISLSHYKKFNDFKKDVLERAKREINEKTDIFIGYEEEKIARKITSIRFSIKKNPEYKKTAFEKSQQEKAVILQKEFRSGAALIEKIVEYGFTKQAAKRLIQSDTEEGIINAIKAVDIQVSRGQVKNPKAMLKTAIEERWKPDVFISKKIKTKS
ncbi:MAG: RepB family plasmid replication initiator protein [Verrucomicrobia bacterium]|nr:RepB family plasmid replication initiator protein [Verrucomicrobiota bacterium]